MHVNMRADLMFENIEAIWVKIRQADIKYLLSCIYRPPSATTEHYEKSLTRLNVLGWLNIPLFFWMILILITFRRRLYLLIQTTILKLHMMCTSQLTSQHEWLIKPPLCWMSFSCPIQYFIAIVQFLDIHLVTTILFILIWNLEIPNYQWLVTTLWNFVTWKISIWRVSPMI